MVYLGVVIVTVSIEWEWNNEYHSVGWNDYYGKVLPVLPVGTIIKTGDGDHFTLKIKEIIAWYEPGKTLSVYMICDVQKGSGDAS